MDVTRRITLKVGPGLRYEIAGKEEGPVNNRKNIRHKTPAGRRQSKAQQ